MTSPATDLVMVEVWDVPTRVFHWVNAACVLVLTGTGLVILFGSSLGLSNEGKVLLKIAHAWAGYLFLLNLLWRFVWAFAGNRHARWRAMLPGGPGYCRALRCYVWSLVSGRPKIYVGHNPLGRIAVTILLLVMLVQGVTGLVLAGTDIYYPPFGYLFADWVAAPGVSPGDVVPNRPELVDEGTYADMREFRAPFIDVHKIGFFVLLGLIAAHVLAVVLTELREGGTLTSAMITGRKVLPLMHSVEKPSEFPEQGHGPEPPGQDGASETARAKG